MFTGIVEATAEVVSVSVSGGGRGRTLAISAAFARELAKGQSVAVDGACLTATGAGASTFTAELGASTLERTIAGGYSVGSRVNVERAIRAGDPLDGHLVQGHVDGLGTLLKRETAGTTRFLDFELPAGVFSTTVLYGSIALNGVSLTVNRLKDAAVCQVAIIPHTWEHTNLCLLEPGDRVNVEADLIGKYVRRMMETHAV